MTLALAVVSVSIWAADEPTPYRFGALPQFSPSRMEEVYAPVAEDLSRAIERVVVFHTTLTFDKFYQQLKAQTYDVVFLPPLYYLSAVDEFGYLPLARLREPLKALMVVPDQSAIRNVSDLRDKTIATPPNFAVITILAKQALRGHGLLADKSVTYKETKSGESCLQQTLIGAAQACVASSFGIATFEQSTGVTMRVILETPALGSFAMAVHKRLPAPDRSRIKAAVLGWQASPAGQTLLKNLNTQGFVETTDADYESLRAFVRTMDEPWPPSAP